MSGGAPQFYMFPCSHGNMSFVLNQKEARKSKELFMKGEVLILVRCVLLRFGNTLGLMPLGKVPLPPENALI